MFRSYIRSCNVTLYTSPERATVCPRIATLLLTIAAQLASMFRCWQSEYSMEQLQESGRGRPEANPDPSTSPVMNLAPLLALTLILTLILS